MTDTTTEIDLSHEAPIRTKTWSWRAITYFTIIHVLGVVGVFFASLWTIWVMIVIFFLYHLSTRIGAHSWAAHAAFKASKVVGYSLVTLFSGNVQGKKLWWSPKHRHHHARENMRGEDPHTPLDGWFHSHMGWVLTKEGMTPAPKKYAIHLLREKDGQYAPIFWQARHYFKLAILMGFVVPTLLGTNWFSSDPIWLSILGAFLLNCTRLMLQYHFTWDVNSVCHGGKKGAAINIWLLAIPTVGESFHKNHHESPGNPRIGRKWWEIDLGWYVIWLLNQLGLIWNLKNPNPRKVVAP